MPNLERQWQLHDQGWLKAEQLDRKNHPVKKKIYMQIGTACEKLLSYNDDEFIRKMKIMLGADSVGKSDICRYVSRMAEQKNLDVTDRWLRKIYPDEWKRAYHLEHESELFRIMPMGRALMKAELTAYLLSLTEDEREEFFKTADAVVNPRGPAKEPTISEYLNVWDNIGKLPEECVAGMNFIKYGKLLVSTHPEHGEAEVCNVFGYNEYCPEGVCMAGFIAIKFGHALIATHPEHGNHYCYMAGQLPAYEIDDRNDIPHLLKQEVHYMVKSKELSIREGFKKYLNEIIKQDKTPKWGKILDHRFVDWLERAGVRIPKPEGENENYTARQKRKIFKLIEKYYEGRKLKVNEGRSKNNNNNNVTLLAS